MNYNLELFKKYLAERMPHTSHEELSIEQVVNITKAFDYSIWCTQHAFKNFGKALQPQIAKPTQEPGISFSTNNRWKRQKRMRACNWVIVGISIKWQNPTNYIVKFHFFGFDLGMSVTKKELQTPKK